MDLDLAGAAVGQSNTGIYGVAKSLTIALATALVLGGCTAPFADAGTPEGADRSLYLGPMPAPAALSAEPGPKRPVAPADPTDNDAAWQHSEALDAYNQAMAEVQDEYIAYLDEVETLIAATKLGGEQSVAAWQPLLVTAGIAVAGPDGAPIDVNGNTGFGWAMTDAEVRMHALLATTPGGMRLVDLAEALQATPGLADIDLAALISGELIGPSDQGFNSVFNRLDANPLFSDAGIRELDEVVLSWAQVGLLVHRLSAEFAVSDAGGGVVPASMWSVPDDGALQVITAAYAHAVPASSSGKPCEVKIDNPWAAELVNQLNKAHATFVFDKVIDTVAGGVGSKLSIARTLSAFAMMGMKAAALGASFSMNDSPLVRTKTPQAGELRELTVKYEFDKDSWEEIRGCMNLFMAPFGIEVPGSQSGLAGNIEVDLASEEPGRLRIGDGKGGATPVMQGTTNNNGETKFTLSGAPQPDFIPEQAEAEEVTVTVRAVSNLGANDFNKDIASLPWDAMDAVGTAGISVVPAVLSRMKLITHTAAIPVRDWSLEADFETTLVATIDARASENFRTADQCGHTGRVFSSTTEATASMATDTVLVSAVLLSNPDGNLGDQAAVFVPTGQEFQGFDSGNGVTMFEMPANYTTTRTHSEPGIAPLPPLEQLVSKGICGGGDEAGTYTPPASDCGKRDYSSTVEVTVPSPQTLRVTDTGWVDSLWEECGNLYTVDPPVGASPESCEAGKQTGGKMPSIRDLYDSSKRIIEVSGAVNCSSEETGSSRSYSYEWTLILCRIVDGQSAC